MSILLITNKTDITSDFVVKKLHKRNLPFYRLNTEDIGSTVTVTFDFEDSLYTLFDIATRANVNLKGVTCVYYRRPEINADYDRLTKGEQKFIYTELLYTLEGLYKILDHAFWVNKVEAIRNAENKIYQLIVARKLGFKLPTSIVTSDPEAALSFFERNDKECIIKPIKAGLIKGDKEEAVIFTSKLSLNEENKYRVSSCPVYLQSLIKKNADIRVTVVGGSTYAAMIHSQDDSDGKIDWRKANRPLKHTVIVLPDDLSQNCIRLTQTLGLNYGAIDFILDQNGSFIFLEINPNGQWAWIENRLDLNIADGITDLLEQNMAI